MYIYIYTYTYIYTCMYSICVYFTYFTRGYSLQMIPRDLLRHPVIPRIGDVSTPQMSRVAPQQLHPL